MSAREQAAELRDKGLYYSQIAERLGVATSTVWRWVNPEAQREIELRRNGSKRRWDRDNYWRPCPRCGLAMSVKAKQCRDCWSKQNGV